MSLETKARATLLADRTTSLLAHQPLCKAPDALITEVLAALDRPAPSTRAMRWTRLPLVLLALLIAEMIRRHLPTVTVGLPIRQTAALLAAQTRESLATITLLTEDIAQVLHHVPTAWWCVFLVPCILFYAGIASLGVLVLHPPRGRMTLEIDR
jgi:hypothetical protein